MKLEHLSIPDIKKVLGSDGNLLKKQGNQAERPPSGQIWGNLSNNDSHEL